MKNRNKYKIIVSSCIVMLCMMFIVLFNANDAEATDNKITYHSGYVYSSSKYVDGEQMIAPDAPAELSGYLFAGWFTSEDEGKTFQAVREPKDGETYYAKFVPKEVLGIKAQVSATLLDNDTENDDAAIRLVTTIDSTQYKEIGFRIQRGDKDYDAPTTKYVYKELYAVDATAENPGNVDTTYTPASFHSQSVYFKTWTIGSIPGSAYDTDITVTPYWVTLDGTRVNGTASIKTVNLGRSWIYVDSTSTSEKELGTLNAPYKTIANAAAHTTTLEPTVILNSDITVDSALSISRNLTLTNKASVTIIENVSDSGNLFTVPGNVTFTITGAEDTMITIDGADTTAEAGSLINVAADGALNMTNVEMKNAYSSEKGGAIYNSGTLTLEGGCKFTGNKALAAAAICNEGTLNDTSSIYTSNVGTDTTSGGAIRNENEANATFAGSQFISNSSAYYGGAVYSAGSKHEMTDCTFSSNVAAQNGGALYINLHYGEFLGMNCVFSKNEANGGSYKYGGGAIWFTDGEHKATLLNNSKDAEGNYDFTNASFVSNTAKGNAGAIYNEGVELWITGYKFDGNNTTVNVGAIYNNAGTIYDTASVYAFNSTSGNSGAVLNSSGATFEKIGGSFNNNSATNGGAVRNEGTFQVTDVEFVSNESTTSNSSNGGGAVYNNGGTFTLLGGCKFTSNTAAYQGGAIWSKGTLTDTGSTYTNNTATKSGGGAILFNYSSGTLTASGCTFTGNTAANSYGGAVYASEGTMDIDDCTFNTNSAKNGGAFALKKGAITNSTFSGNTLSSTSGNGSAIFAYGTTLTDTATFTAETTGNTFSETDTVYARGN